MNVILFSCVIIKNQVIHSFIHVLVFFTHISNQQQNIFNSVRNEFVKDKVEKILMCHCEY